MKAQVLTHILGQVLTLSILLSCGEKSKTPDSGLVEQDTTSVFQDQIYQNDEEISIEAWEKIEPEFAPQIGVQMGMNFFALSRQIDINAISANNPRPKQTFDYGPDEPTITDRASLKKDVEYLRSNYTNPQFWQLLRSKEKCQIFSIILIGAESADYEEMSLGEYSISEKEQLIRMRTDTYLQLRRNVEWVYASTGRFLDSVSDEELEYYSTTARQYDFRGLYWLEASAIKPSELYEKWLKGEDSEGKLDSAFYLICRQFLSMPDAEFDCLDKLKHKTLSSSELVTLISSSRAGKNAMFLISPDGHLPASEYQVETNETKTQITVFAQRPTDPKFAKFFQESIENFWKTEKYQLNLAWADENGREAMIHTEFVKDGTNRASKESRAIMLNIFRFRYDESMATTIAHEFGHLLGFRDCYVEFYDDDTQSMIDYVSDVNNIMCTNAGWVQDQHFVEFLKVQE